MKGRPIRQQIFDAALPVWQYVKETTTNATATYAEWKERLPDYVMWARELQKLPFISAAQIEGITEVEGLFQPQANLNGKELEQYVSTILLNIVCNPENVDSYKLVLTKESIDLIKSIDWYYEEPQEVYQRVLYEIPIHRTLYTDVIITAEEGKYVREPYEPGIVPKVKDEMQTRYKDEMNLGIVTLELEFAYDKNSGVLDISFYDFYGSNIIY